MLEYFLLVVAVSASGALSPGPLFLATINSAIKSGKYSGFAVALGHMAFELPLVVAIGFGIWNFLGNHLARAAIGLLGASALIAFGALQLRSSIKDLSRSGGEIAGHVGVNAFIESSGLFSAFLVGLIFTALNPYFIMWWFTIGLSLIAEAIKISALTGIFIMFIFHIWLDYAWLGFTGYATAVGSRLLKPRYLTLISLSLAILIVILGIILLESTMATL
ncbi:MAG: LysE family transporter [Nitrososphaeria archaeon]|nr:LysE family transporter [Nitrososphaeria archaeon]